VAVTVSEYRFAMFVAIMCELNEYGRHVAKCMHFMTNVCLDNSDVAYVISIGLISNGVAMFVLLYGVVHVVCLHPGVRDFLGFPEHSNIKGTPPPTTTINFTYRETRLV